LNIPNDNNKNYRLNKFVEYQNEVPPVHRKICILYVKERKLNEKEILFFSWLMANFYHEITSFLFFDLCRKKPDKKKFIKSFYKRNKERIQLGSAKIKSKIRDRVLQSLIWFDEEKENRIIDILKTDKTNSEKYEDIEKFILKAPQFGRFSSDLFLEMLITFYEKKLFRYKILLQKKLDWKNCANLTSGVLNIIYEDKLADDFDRKKIKTNQLKKLIPRLEKTLDIIKIEIDKKYDSNKDKSQFITKLCSFRNLFKGKRYAGYHHDRQLNYIIKYKKNFPEYDDLWKECLKFRKKCYPKRFLGELHNWRGIRPNRKKLWIEKGLTGAEKKTFNDSLNYELF